jgi:hypothetical protein
MSYKEIERLRLLGFRKWYERQLFDGHASLVLAIFAVVIMACGFELVSIRDQSLGIVGHALLIFGGCVVAWKALIRYQRIMVNAEYVGGHANCPSCGKHGFKWPKDDPPADEKGLEIKALCGRCKTRWKIDLAEEGKVSGF